MTTKEAMAKAAELFAEWVEGDEFEYEGTTPGKYYDCPATDVVRWLFGDVAVRIKPRPKKVLRPAWEILRDATSNGLVRTYAGETLIYKNAGFQITLADIFTHDGMPQDELNAEWPDWFFIEEAK